jgi:hypothetical protein
MQMRRRNLRACSVGLWLVAAVVVRADDTDDFIRAEMKHKNIPGLSLVVLKHGEVIKSRGYGLANRALETHSRESCAIRRSRLDDHHADEPGRCRDRADRTGSCTQISSGVAVNVLARP